MGMEMEDEDDRRERLRRRSDPPPPSFFSLGTGADCCATPIKIVESTEMRKMLA